MGTKDDPERVREAAIEPRGAGAFQQAESGRIRLREGVEGGGLCGEGFSGEDRT